MKNKTEFTKLTESEYNLLKELGILFEAYPEATGDYAEDMKPKKKPLVEVLEQGIIVLEAAKIWAEKNKSIEEFKKEFNKIWKNL